MLCKFVDRFFFCSSVKMIKWWWQFGSVTRWLFLLLFCSLKLYIRWRNLYAFKLIIYPFCSLYFLFSSFFCLFLSAFLRTLHIDTYQRSLIVKRQIANLARRKLFRADRAFANEIVAYTKVMPQLYQFADSIELPIPFANCLFAGNDDAGDLIVLEDLKPFGYRMANRLKGLDYSHCKIALKVICCFYFVFSMGKRWFWLLKILAGITP